jgi:hypothetical protein
VKVLACPLRADRPDEQGIWQHKMSPCQRLAVQQTASSLPATIQLAVAGPAAASGVLRIFQPVFRVAAPAGR